VRISKDWKILSRFFQSLEKCGSMKTAPRYWLMKTEPEVFSIDDLQRDGVTAWTGVRNYQARNFMKAMAVGDRVLVYHSSCAVPGVAGLAEVSRAAFPDASQFDRAGAYFDPRATREKPVWACVEVRFARKFKGVVALDVLRQAPALKGMLVLKRGMRLSVQPVDRAHFDQVLALAGSRRTAAEFRT
jgi:predicted RNA-binding protein with PUA-like domain